jgi:hypothetical protein
MRFLAVALLASGWFSLLALWLVPGNQYEALWRSPLISSAAPLPEDSDMWFPAVWFTLPPLSLEQSDFCGQRDIGM